MNEQATRWLSNDEQLTWRSFIVAANRVDAALDRQLQRDAGMPHAYYGILVTLSEAEGRAMRMGELADALHYSRSRVAHAVSKMETRGWIRREHCPDDRRGQIAVLTGSGLAALEHAAPGHVAEVRRLVLDPLSATEQRTLHRLLEHINDHLP
jgi:DNA-binding MarR family transcriptional regulator